MAADQNQERDLRAVIENLVSHPSFRRIVSDAVQGNNLNNNGNAINVSSSPGSTTNTSSSSSSASTTYSSPQQELQAIFRAGAGGQGCGRGGGTVA